MKIGLFFVCVTNVCVCVRRGVTRFRFMSPTIGIIKKIYVLQMRMVSKCVGCIPKLLNVKHVAHRFPHTPTGTPPIWITFKLNVHEICEQTRFSVCQPGVYDVVRTNGKYIQNNSKMTHILQSLARCVHKNKSIYPQNETNIHRRDCVDGTRRRKKKKKTNTHEIQNVKSMKYHYAGWHGIQPFLGERQWWMCRWQRTMTP